MTEKHDEILSGRNGYAIPCRHNLKGDEAAAVVVSHGFGSSMESPTVKAITDALASCGIGALAFDFPAHGASPVEGDKLRIKNCLDDLATAEARVHSLAPKAEIFYFSSSFGAYVNLLYLSSRPHLGRKSFLRCAAVDMPGIFRDLITPEQVAALEAQEFILLDYDSVRPLKVTCAFAGDLLVHDVFRLYTPGTAALAMIHGDADETASIEKARRFAALSGAAFTVVSGADHRFQNPGGMERVLAAALQFFQADSRR